VNIGIDEARPGMRLVEDISLPRRKGVVKKSEPITGKSIALLRKAGITRISIQSDDSPGSETGEPAAVPEQAAPDTAPAQNVKKLMPIIMVIVHDDCLAADLIIEPAGEECAEISVETLLAALDKKGVSYGINRDLLDKIVRQWADHKRRHEFENIARGIAPQAGVEGAFQLCVQHLASMRDLEVVQQSTYHWQAADHIGNIQRIDKGMVLAEKPFTTPSQPGINVRGEPVLSEDSPVEAKISLGDGVAFSTDRSQIIALADGVCYYVNDTIGIFNLDFNGSIDILIASDRMSAQLCLHPPGEGGSMPGEKAIDNLLTNNLISSGIMKAAIEDLLKSCGEGNIPHEPVTIAIGTPPVHGKKGEIEFLFNINTSLAPKINPDGSADYKEVDIVIAVTKGKPLARVIAPTEGTPGKTIFGEDLPCKEGSPAVLPIGPGTEIDAKDDDLLVAAIDGIVRYTGSYVEVSEGYIINGNVDYSTGHVRYNKSVIINGDVKTGFNIECGGDLQVSGIIEDSSITVGGSVLCKHGFVGHGQGVIDAKGDVNVGFILNQTIKARKNVNVAKESINGTIYSRQSVHVHGNPLSVAGGMIVAREMISAHTVGNHSGVRTDLEVGLDFTLVEELKKNEAQETELGLKAQKLLEPITKYRHRTAHGHHLGESEETLFTKLKIAYAKIEEQKRLLEKRKELIKTKLHELDNSYISIEHGAMPGTHFKIGERRNFLKEEVIGPKTVRLINQEIIIQ
jgi:hypothetical protein